MDGGLQARDHKHTDAQPHPGLTESLGSRTAHWLSCRPASIRWTRFTTSRANYVYRAQHGRQSLVVKTSDNVAVKTGWEMPPFHLVHEYRFLQEARKIQPLRSHLPKPVEFLEEDNAILMSDLGPARHLVIGGLPRLRSMARTFSTLGSWLALLHQHAFPADFIASLQRREVSERFCRFLVEPPLHADWDFNDDFQNSAKPGVTLMDPTPRNVLITNHRFGLALVDFDFVAYGRQEVDIARFLHFVLWRALARNDRRLALAGAAYLQGYRLNHREPREDAALLTDPSFLRWLLAMLHQKFVRTVDDSNRTLPAGVLQEVGHRPADSWEGLVEQLFTRRAVLLAR